MMNTGVYKILNTANARVYIGSSLNMAERFRKHRGALDLGRHENHQLQEEWREFGPGVFVFTPLTACAESERLNYEQIWIDAFDAAGTGYNLRPHAGSGRGLKHSPEVRAKISASCKQAIRKPKTAEHLAKIAGALMGRKLSAEARAKIRLANLGKKNGPPSAATRSKMSAAQKGRKLSAEHVEALKRGQQARRAREKTMPTNDSSTALIRIA